MGRPRGPRPRRDVPHRGAGRREDPPTAGILIVEDHTLFAEAIRTALQDAGLGPVEVVSDGGSALIHLEEHAPDVVLLDLGLPDQSGFAVGAQMLDRSPRLRILALTALDDPRAVEEAHALGFRGFLTKDIPVSRFVGSVRVVMDGGSVFPHRRPRRRATGRNAGLLMYQLTPREREVLGLLVEGADSPGIASHLGISRNTVRTHVQSILTKLQVHTRLEAATFAVRHGLVPIGNGYDTERAGDRSPDRL